MAKWDLERFVVAQEGVYETALHELRAGRKRSHFMWFVFPQLQGLGQSAQSKRYAIASLSEARAYLSHPVLGPRLEECTRAMMDQSTRPLEDILGEVDAKKFRSSMTLFSKAHSGESIFSRALEQCCAHTMDPLTLRLLDES